MKLVPLDPDPKMRRLAHGIAVAAVILLSAVALPLLRLQFGPLGWRLVRDAAGSSFWPLGGLAAAGAALLMAYALWLRRRPQLAPLLLLFPCALAGIGAVLGMGQLPSSSTFGPAALVTAADSLATPAWALSLAAGLAAAGAVVLGALTLRRARELSAPWWPLLAAITVLLLATAYTQYARLPVRPYTVVVLGAALLAPVLVAAPWASDAPPDPTGRQAAVVPIALLLTLVAAVAAAAAEALVFRAAALYAQGPGAEAHVQSLAFGGARSTTARFGSGALPVLGTLAVITVATTRLREELWPRGRAAAIGVATTLLLAALAIGLFGAHRYQLRSAIERANRLGAPPPSAPMAPSGDTPARPKPPQR